MDTLMNTIEQQGKTTEAVTRPHVVIVGAGFGGLRAARALLNKQLDVTILDRNNYHQFQPLLYQVATAGLEPEAIASPVRALLHKATKLPTRWPMCAASISSGARC